MRFLYPAYGIDFMLQENSRHYLCIEHPRAYAEMVQALYQQCHGGEGGAVLSDGLQPLSLEKQAALILDPFTLTFNDRKIQTALYKELQALANECHCEAYLSLQGQLQHFVELLSQEVPYPIYYDECINSNGLYKLMNVHIDYGYESIVEKLSGYMGLLAQLCHCQVFFLADCERYLTAEEQAALQEMANYHKLYVVYITTSFNGCSKGDCYCILDRDYCVITNSDDEY